MTPSPTDGWRADELRLSDSERERASTALGEHFAQGRLDADEHAERHERIWSAKTRGEIPPLFSDLPGGSPLHPAPPRTPGPTPATPPWVAPTRYPRPRRLGLPLPVKIAFGIALFVLVITNWWLVLIALGVVWLFSHKGGSRSRRQRSRYAAYGGHGPCAPRGWSTS